VRGLLTWAQCLRRLHYAINRAQEAEMEFTIIELAALILISLWGLVAMGKLLQRLSAIVRTLQEIKLVLQEGKNQAGR
jgi:hypothetical protein